MDHCFLFPRRGATKSFDWLDYARASGFVIGFHLAASGPLESLDSPDDRAPRRNHLRRRGSIGVVCWHAIKQDRDNTQ
jgi:hypothetical protein